MTTRPALPSAMVQAICAILRTPESLRDDANRLIAAMFDNLDRGAMARLLWTAGITTTETAALKLVDEIISAARAAALGSAKGDA